MRLRISRTGLRRRWASLMLGACALALRGGGSCAADEADDGHVIVESGDRIELSLPAIPGLAEIGTGGLLKGEWQLRTERQKIWIRVHAYPPSFMTALDPMDVAAYETAELDPFDQSVRCEGIQYQEYVKGVAGGQMFGALVGGVATHPDYGTGEFIVFAGVHRNSIFDVIVLRFGDAEPGVRSALLKFLTTGVRADAPSHDPSWADVRQAKSWVSRVVPAEIDTSAFEVVLRTKHFVLISDTKAPAGVGNALEQTYDLVKKIAPFEEPVGRCLIPGLMFKKASQYRAFCASRLEAPLLTVRSAGHSRPECFSMYVEDWQEKVLRHEAAHQLFRSRVRLFGGGSWLQEGLAEYASTSADERRRFEKTAASSGRYVPLIELIRMPALLDADTVAGARDAYAQAASLVEFLRDGAYQPKLFLPFLRRVGVLAWEKPDDVIAAMSAVYGDEIEAIDAAFLAHGKR